MSITLVQGPLVNSSTAVSNTIVKAFTANVTAGNAIVVIGRGVGTAPASTGLTIAVSDSLGNTYAQAVSAAGVPVTDDQKLSILYAKNIAGGACTVTITYTGSPSRQEIQILEIAGLDTTAPLISTNSATGTTTTAISAGVVTTTTAACLIAAVITDYSYQTFTNGTGWTDIPAAAIWNKTDYEYRIEALSGSFTGDFTQSVARSYSAIIVGFKAAASSAATAVTITGPSGGAVGAASSNFTVGANGTITGTVVVTPSDSAGGGTFTPTTVSISSGTPTGTFTYTPASVGAKTISVTNNGSLTNPANITYTAGSRIFLPNWDMSGVSSAGPFFGNRLQ